MFNDSRGFTLLETMTAIFVIAIGVTSIFSLFARSIILTSFSSYKLTAAYLAQEGIEVVRNIRDNNLIAGVTWDQGIPEGTFYVSYLTEKLPDANCSDSSLKIIGGFYRCSTNINARFKRIIIISQKQDLNGNGAADELNVSVNVKWRDRGKNYSLKAEENLYKWF